MLRLPGLNRRLAAVLLPPDLAPIARPSSAVHARLCAFVIGEHDVHSFIRPWAVVVALVSFTAIAAPLSTLTLQAAVDRAVAQAPLL